MKKYTVTSRKREDERIEHICEERMGLCGLSRDSDQGNPIVRKVIQTHINLMTEPQSPGEPIRYLRTVVNYNEKADMEGRYL